MSENNDNILIKTFIRKCTAHAKYGYYAQKAREDDFITVSEQLERIATNELYHAYALLRRLCDENTETNLQDVIVGEEQDIESIKKLINEESEHAEVLHNILQVDLEHLSIAKNLAKSMKNEDTYVLKKCALCGRKDKSGSINKICPQCAHKN